MVAGFVTSLLNSHVRLKNGVQGMAVAVGQSLQGFGLVFTLLLEDGTLQDAHSGDVASVALGGSEARGPQATVGEVRRK